MRETIRDSAFGKILRVLGKRRVLQYPEEADPDCWAQCIHEDTSEQEEHEGFPYYTVEGEVLYTTRSQMSRRLSQTRSRSLHGVSLPGQQVDLEKSQSPKDLKNNYKAVGWRSDDDPENPQNWSTTKKYLISSQIWMITFAIYIGGSIYSPAEEGIEEVFGVSEVVATIGLTLFVAGYGLGPMIWSPLSELPAIGRSPIYVATLFAFIWLNFGVIYAPNIGCIFAFRFLTGFIGSPALATGAASMGDIWSPKMRDYMIIIWGVFAIAAPVLGPTVGGFAAMANGWTWAMWPLIWVSAFTWVVLFFFLPETYAPNILARRAKRIRRLTGSDDYLSEAEIESSEIKPRQILFEALVRPFQLCFTEPIVLVLNLYVALIYGILYIWFEAFPIVFSEIRGFNLGVSGLPFLGLLVGTVVVTIPPYFWWKYKYQNKHFSENGDISPEMQLPPACIGAIAMPISLFWFGWTGNYASISWAAPTVSTIFFSIGGCTIFNCVFCYEAHAYPKHAASVLAGNDLLRSSLGAGFPLFASAMFHNLGVNWATSLLGFLTIAFLPFPFILYFYGRRLRMASKFARHDI